MKRSEINAALKEMEQMVKVTSPDAPLRTA